MVLAPNPKWQTLQKEHWNAQSLASSTLLVASFLTTGAEISTAARWVEAQMPASLFWVPPLCSSFTEVLDKKQGAAIQQEASYLPHPL